MTAPLAASLALPAQLGHLDRRRVGDQMDMRVEVEPVRVRVRVQYRDDAGRGLQRPVVAAAAYRAEQ